MHTNWTFYCGFHFSFASRHFWMTLGDVIPSRERANDCVPENIDNAELHRLDNRLQSL